MGFFDDDEFETLLAESNKFKPQELTEGTVQAIFNRCLVKAGTAKERVSRSILFPRVMGYRPEVEIVFYFDKDRLLENKKNIYYLYGQLNDTWKNACDITLGGVQITYSGKHWTENGAYLRYLLYLGCTDEINLLSPFRNEVFEKFCEPSDRDTAVFLSKVLKPTLSPKDPDFPAWWEAHKGEWEA